jgi:hypothetical protein
MYMASLRNSEGADRLRPIAIGSLAVSQQIKTLEGYMELRLAGKGALPYGPAHYFVCPKSFLALPKVAQFREWIFAAAREFPRPPA